MLGVMEQSEVPESRQSLPENDSRKEAWKKSVREAVEKTIAYKVEQRLDTPPLERMRRRQREARERKLQQLKELERNINVSQGSSASSLGDAWKRKFANGDASHITDSEFLKKLDRMKFPRGTSAALPDPSSSTCSSSADLTGLVSNSPPIESKPTLSLCTEVLDSSNDSDNVFSTSVYETKRLLFRKFSKEGFKEAVRNGKVIPSGGKGVFADDLGMQLSYDGPFWPNGHGPLVKTPNHIDAVPSSPELLSFVFEAEINKTTSEDSARKLKCNKIEMQYGKWACQQQPVLVYDCSRFVTSPVPHDLPPHVAPSLVFESRFECGNLALAFRTGQFEYELILRPDLFTERHTQWYYFSVTQMVPGVTYVFNIINLSKASSLYNYGMRPLMYSELEAEAKCVGWHRIGHHVTYSVKTEPKCARHCRTVASSSYSGGGTGSEVSSQSPQFAVLQWQTEFKNKGDTCYFAHCYPYTFTRLRTFINSIAEKHSSKKLLRKESLCESRAGNSCYLLTITNPEVPERDKKAVLVSGRVHPGESNSSWMMEGFLDFITGDTHIAHSLRNKFVFKVVPMLNPDGVIVGNYRCSLFGKDLNRNYRRPKKEYFPTIWATKNLLDRMCQRCEIVLYVDMHGHSRKQNVFMYGCDSGYREEGGAVAGNGGVASQQVGMPVSSEAFVSERLFPFLMSLKAPDKFSFRSSKFNIKKCKESTGRVVMFRQYNILNSFTMEATFCGTTINGINRHFNSSDFKSVGQTLGEALLEYSSAMEDENAQARYILELTRAVTKQYILDLSPKSDEDVSSAGNSTDKDLLRRQQKLEEISEQLSKSKSLKDCFKLLDSLRLSSNQDNSHESDTDDSDSGSEKEFLGNERKKKPKELVKKKPPAKNGLTSNYQTRGPSVGTKVSKDPISASLADEWYKVETKKNNMLSGCPALPLDVPGLSVGARASAVINEVSYSLFTSQNNSRKHQVMLPSKVAVKVGTDPVSRNAANNPYSGRSTKGLPVFTEERFKEKHLKSPFLTTQLSDPSVWGSRLDNGLHLAPSSSQPRSGSGIHAQRAKSFHGRVVPSSVFNAALTSTFQSRNENSLTKVQSARPNQRPVYVVTEKTVELVPPSSKLNSSTPLRRSNSEKSSSAAPSNTPSIQKQKRLVKMSPSPSDDVKNQLDRETTGVSRSSPTLRRTIEGAKEKPVLETGRERKGLSKTKLRKSSKSK